MTTVERFTRLWTSAEICRIAYTMGAWTWRHTQIAQKTAIPLRRRESMQGEQEPQSKHLHKKQPMTSGEREVTVLGTISVVAQNEQAPPHTQKKRLKSPLTRTMEWHSGCGGHAERRRLT